MVMTRRRHGSGAQILLLILLGITQRLTAAAHVAGERHSDRERDVAGIADLSQMQSELGDRQAGNGLGQTPREEQLLPDVNPGALAAALLEVLTHPEGKKGGSEDEQGDLLEGEGDDGGHEELEVAVVAAAEAREEEERRKRRVEEGGVTEEVKGQTGSQTAPVGKGTLVEEEENDDESQGEEKEGAQKLQAALEELESLAAAAERGREMVLQRQARGYFPNIDLGLQDNEILPPLKGYKLYNQQLAQAGKKLKWEEDRRKNRLQYNGMDDFEEDGADGAEEEEVLTREEEEARARAEQEEIRRQVAEAQRAKAEEEKLADIASDMLLQYMVKKQGAAYGDSKRKGNLGGNAAEDKRSDEEDDDDDDIDPQTIDKLIEISSKLHLPADDVVDIISDVEEKKKKKDSPEKFPRYRPLMPPPAFTPVTRYPPPKQSPPFYGSSRKWYKDKFKVKSSKQKYWSKPHKQVLAYPSYPFYQKPYRAYYPVYFPSTKPKPRYYAKSALSLDDLLGNSMDYDFQPPKRRYRNRKRPSRPRNPYISNYILPHPRTYQALPMLKPRLPPRHRQTFYYPSAAMVSRDDDYYNRLDEQDSDEELENFIEKVYLKRRMYK
ncbi:neurosecretory protein VGF [Megalops cyprinoides]|uniref:neurosecretory protein VGF n=1 Tax=Megalops cyprinoides TaxID=118141 RepID=UPI001865679E|nr:neurosecretory protein VGF [Megalops cyprinoides]